MVKAELLEHAEDKVTLPPFAITVALCVWVLPTVTLPKLMEPGVTPMVPLVVVPLPVRETVTDEFVAFDAMAWVALFDIVVINKAYVEKVGDRNELFAAIIAAIEFFLSPSAKRRLHIVGVIRRLSNRTSRLMFWVTAAKKNCSMPGVAALQPARFALGLRAVFPTTPGLSFS
jgi:hypothetical protein